MYLFHKADCLCHGARSEMQWEIRSQALGCSAEVVVFGLQSQGEEVFHFVFRRNMYLFAWFLLVGCFLGLLGVFLLLLISCSSSRWQTWWKVNVRDVVFHDNVSQVQT